MAPRLEPGSIMFTRPSVDVMSRKMPGKQPVTRKTALTGLERALARQISALPRSYQVLESLSFEGPADLNPLLLRSRTCRTALHKSHLGTATPHAQPGRFEEDVSRSSP